MEHIISLLIERKYSLESELLSNVISAHSIVKKSMMCLFIFCFPHDYFLFCVTYVNMCVVQKHSVTCLGAASSVGRLLVLVDGLVHLLDHKALTTVTTASRHKGVTTFCLNHNPINPDPFALEVILLGILYLVWFLNSWSLQQILL